MCRYGTHWNFFITLSLVHFVCLTLLRAPLQSPTTSLIVAVLFLGVYQTVLVQSSLTQYIFDAARVSLLSHNREGLVSTIGFASAFLFGVSLKRRLHGVGGFTIASISGVACLLLHHFVQPISRRLANASYVCMIVSLDALILSLLHYVHATPGSLLESVSKFQLAVFLVANVATGVINLSIHTISTGVQMSMVIILTYATVLCLATDFVSGMLRAFKA
jgi:phosphatidylinositol glycan class W